MSSLYHLRKFAFKWIMSISLSFFALPSAYAKESLDIILPRSDAKVDPNEAYVSELLQLIIQHSPRPYRLIYSKGRMEQGRSIYEMTKPDGKIDLLWSMTTDTREKQLIPIRIPIDKGLIGWRISLIKEKNRSAFSKIKKAEDLKPYTAGQGSSWPDVAILKANQLPVLTSIGYDSLFTMLAGERFDYFPRSVFEIWNELKSHHDQTIEVEQSFILHYPSACYIFITPRRPQVAEDLRQGFEKIIANGLFEKLFQHHNQENIERAKIKQRTVIQLNNPLLNINSMPLKRAELWFQTPAH
ncbi:hypothetical protein H8K52_08155 [Undibacterium seohonense]|uniref:Solute-binding protein family 3/N-terminal domain-containing protein n=1 Tax=Undibacterium seohonense TaxID=1344950 RepID=A0ABR6X4P1_9BURK|nr:hypothetical protein [Undibacterium seohonense]MBC3807314.1 hypothetical protein [Undibacterium seohonense]